MSPRIQKREYTTPPPFSLEWMNESKKCQARCVLWRQTKFFFLLQCISMTPLLFDTHKNSDEIYYKGAPMGSKKWWCATGLGRNLQPLGWIWEPQEHSMGDWFLCLTGENHCPEFWVRFNLPQKLHTYIRNQFWSQNRGNLHPTFRVWQKKCTTSIPWFGSLENYDVYILHTFFMKEKIKWATRFYVNYIKKNNNNIK